MAKTALHGWAETTVKEKGAGYPPEHGDRCPECRRILKRGQRVFRVTERDDNAWVHEEHVADG